MEKIIRQVIIKLEEEIILLKEVKREAFKEQDEKLYNDTVEEMKKVNNKLNIENRRLIKFLNS